MNTSRRFSSTLVPPQLFAAPARRQESPSQLSWPNSPGLGGLCLRARIEPPSLEARVCVQRNDSRRGGRQKHHAANDDGRALDGRALAGIAGMIRPGHAQAADVAAVDLVERRVARAALI